MLHKFSFKEWLVLLEALNSRVVKDAGGERLDALLVKGDTYKDRKSTRLNSSHT